MRDSRGWRWGRAGKWKLFSKIKNSRWRERRKPDVLHMMWGRAHVACSRYRHNSSLSIWWTCWKILSYSAQSKEPLLWNEARAASSRLRFTLHKELMIPGESGMVEVTLPCHLLNSRHLPSAHITETQHDARDPGDYKMKHVLVPPFGLIQCEAVWRMFSSCMHICSLLWGCPSWWSNQKEAWGHMAVCSGGSLRIVAPEVHEHVQHGPAIDTTGSMSTRSCFNTSQGRAEEALPCVLCWASQGRESKVQNDIWGSVGLGSFHVRQGWNWLLSG